MKKSAEKQTNSKSTKLSRQSNSVGAVMTKDFVDLKLDMTVQQALDRIRDIGKNSIALTNCYITDEAGAVIGKVSIRRLILSDTGESLKKIYNPNVTVIEPTTDNMTVAAIMRRELLPSLPVVDSAKSRKLIGIVTIEQIPDIIEREATRELSAGAGIVGTKKDRPYLATSIWQHVKSRLPWLIFLVFAALLAGMLVARYEESFLKMPILVTFIPMIMGIAGAGGSQAATVIIRSMAIGEITQRQYFRAISKEFMVSIVSGALLGLVIFTYIMVVEQNIVLGFVLWLGLLATVIFAKVLGTLLPIIAKAVRIDPALISSPLVTIIADIFGIFAYFSFARLLLGI
ncbi:magnesium transporter [Candidatus Saccharibacteria bacterium]|nr:magnesium transporter [Candidatus Saccharibacteria bacterium]